MRKSNMSGYINVLSKVLQGTEDEAGEMNADFEKMRTAIDNDTVSDLSQADLQAVVDNFQRGTDGYEDKLNQLEQASVPVRVLGKHKSLVAAFRTYTEACQAMTDSIDVEHQAVDVAAFNQSEKTQENAMEKVTAATQRIMTSPM
ncbi:MULTISPECIES: hypothetical protein [Lactobacillaceae]|uniref:hypothetical protein n=1 Tax=Lactobacillaceae TaxID=33958 RepID=UPI001457662A|nr:hypothetical protein [Lactobacillus sp. HBUAS51381]NLR10665.1 hypothetical protein [Lactobacillus sp. HBUAS51381]